MAPSIGAPTPPLIAVPTPAPIAEPVATTVDSFRLWHPAITAQELMARAIQILRT